ncbi:hypothetical protein JW933_04375 [candidate division FCPU426 bacterium]|nr:hypothetical protein [candidate division FCPU426 bacterium]
MKIQREIEQFRRFMEKETYADICLPDLATPDGNLGIFFKISPLKEEKGQPEQYADNIENKHWVIKIERTLSPISDSYPIQAEHYYYCDYFNESWYTRPTTFLRNMHRFYLATKGSRGGHDLSADDLVAAIKAKQKKG